MTNEALYCDPEFAQLYDWDNPWPEDFDFIASLAAEANRVLDLGECFDMVLMTGHAFQTLLSRDDRSALIGTIARHLTPGGRFFFDSRNPEVREWEQWDPDASRAVLPHPQFGSIERWNDANCSPLTGIVTYDTFYRFDSGRLLSASSQIAFAPQTEIRELIVAAGLTVDRWIGDCKDREFSTESPEIIPLGSRKA